MSRSSLIHSSIVPFITTSLSTVNIMVDSVYKSTVKFVKVVVMLLSNTVSTVLEMVVLSYVMLTGTIPGRVTYHVSCTVSLLDAMEHLYNIVSPGQLISSLKKFLSARVKLTLAIQMKVVNYNIQSINTYQGRMCIHDSQGQESTRLYYHIQKQIHQTVESHRYTGKLQLSPPLCGGRSQENH